MRQRSAINPFTTSPSAVSPSEGVTAAEPVQQKATSSGPWTEHTWKWRGHSIHYKVRRGWPVAGKGQELWAWTSRFPEGSSQGLRSTWAR